MLSRAQNTFHHNPRLRGPVSSIDINLGTKLFSQQVVLILTLDLAAAICLCGFSDKARLKPISSATEAILARQMKLSL